MDNQNHLVLLLTSLIRTRTILIRKKKGKEEEERNSLSTLTIPIRKKLKAITVPEVHPLTAVREGRNV